MNRAVLAALSTWVLSACSPSEDSSSAKGSGAHPISTEAPAPAAPEPAATPVPAGLTVHDCATAEGYAVSSYVRPAPTGADLVVLGLYESRSDHGAGYHPEGTATVHVRRTTPHTLVLSSYEPTLWRLDVSPDARIESVILNGLHAQRVTGLPPNARVIDRSGSDFLAACAYQWPGDTQGCATSQLVSGLRALTSRDVTAFAGCYRATEFSVGERPVSAPPKPDPKPDPNPRPAVTHRVTCTPGQGALTTYVAPELGSPELHLLGVYETHSHHGDGEHPAGAATVEVTRTTPLILALSSYEPVDWTVTAVPGARIERIVLNGYHDQRVTAPPGVPVEVHTGEEWLGDPAYAWPASSGGSDTPRLVSALERLTSRKLSSFAGCYQGTAFELGQ